MRIFIVDLTPLNEVISIVEETAVESLATERDTLRAASDSIIRQSKDRWSRLSVVDGIAIFDEMEPGEISILATEITSAILDFVQRVHIYYAALKYKRSLSDREKAVRVPLSELISQVQALLPKQYAVPTRTEPESANNPPKSFSR